MGFFTLPTSAEMTDRFGDILDGPVRAFIIGQFLGGRAAVMVTDREAVFVPIALFKLKASLPATRSPLGSIRAKVTGLQIQVGPHKMKLGMMDLGRAHEVADLVNAAAGA